MENDMNTHVKGGKQILSLSFNIPIGDQNIISNIRTSCAERFLQNVTRR
jgi:hypothetical protein